MDLITKVKKPVEAIQCVNTFSLLQRKMYNALLANAAGNLYPDATHRIGMKALCGLMGYRSNDYKTLKSKFRELRRMDIEWDIINADGNKVWTNTSPLSLARVIEGEGICEYEFTPSLVPFLDRPAQYAKFSLAIQAKFKSCYGLALYENCERYKKIGYTRTFDIPMFRKLMGVGQEEYLEFFALKRRVINKAVNEVNQHADFDIEPEYRKKGRTVVSIRFLIYVKERHLDKIVQQEQKTTTDQELENKIIKYFGAAERDIKKYFQKYGYAYVKEKVDAILNSESFKKGFIKNMAGYLKTALIENYQQTISSQSAAEKQRREKTALRDVKQKKHDLVVELQRAYDNHLSTHISEIILKKLTKENVACLLEEFKPHIVKTCYLDLYEREGLNNILVCDHFVAFIKKAHTKLLNKLMSFENYIQQKHAEKNSTIETLAAVIKKIEAGV
jgi:plasmid replication initiation protein